MTTYVCGNSHIAALAAGAEDLPPDPEVRFFPLGTGRYERSDFSLRGADGVELLPQRYQQNLEDYTGHQAIVPGPRWGFLLVNSTARVHRHPMWQSFGPSDLVQSGRTPVTASLLGSILQRDHEGVRGFFMQLLGAGVDFFAVSAPHPRQGGKTFRRRVPREVIGRIDATSREMWRQWLGARGIPLVEPPPETATEDGFLRNEYALTVLANGERDPHHANAAYGRLMAHRVRAHVAATRPV